MADTRVLTVGEPRVRARRAASPLRSPLSLVGILVRQACHELRVRRLRGIAFRTSRNDEACRAYAALRLWEFEGINERQAWANWRTIRRNLQGRAPRRPVSAIDLCCGTGDSTEVLAWCLEPGSSILGVDADPRFVAAARQRCYLTRRGRPADVRFGCQSVLEPLCDDAHEPIADASVDVVNASGAVGCHFEAKATALLAAEVDRVLRPGGLALIDCGPDGTSPRQLREIFEALGHRAIHRARSCAFDRYWQLCFCKPDA
jgi:SAM-dependent methyltransferase